MKQSSVKKYEIYLLAVKILPEEIPYFAAQITQSSKGFH
jgi:hypothetical protein